MDFLHSVETIEALKDFLKKLFLKFVKLFLHNMVFGCVEE